MWIYQGRGRAATVENNCNLAKGWKLKSELNLVYGFSWKISKKSWAQSLLWVMALLSFYRSWDLGDILISWIGGEINVHPRSAGSAVFDSKPINHNHFVLGPFLYCFSNKNHKLALEGEKYQMRIP